MVISVSLKEEDDPDRSEETTLGEVGDAMVTMVEVIDRFWLLGGWI